MAIEKEVKPIEQGPIKPTQLPADEKEKGVLLAKIGEILKEYGGLESNIPFNHDYWMLVNRYRSQP